MKKVLLYIATAVLLGTVTMVAPLRLLKPSYYNIMTSRGAQAAQASPEFYKTLDGREAESAEAAFERAVSPPNLRSAGLMLAPSLLLALGVSLYLKKRIF